MKKIELAIFDMAGTTIDEGNLVYKTVQHVLCDNGYSITLEDVLQHGAGKEKHQAMIGILQACTSEVEVEKVAIKLFEQFKPALEKAYKEHAVQSFPGVAELFVDLHRQGIKVALNTGYDKHTAQLLLAKVGWQVGKEIDALVTADDVAKSRPHPDMIFKAMEILAVSSADKVLKAGDSAIDIEEGKNAGCGITVGVLSGAQRMEQLEAAQPDYIFKHLKDLSKILFV